MNSRVSSATLRRSNENKLQMKMRPSSAYQSQKHSAISVRARLQDLLVKNQILNGKIEVANNKLSSLKLLKNGTSRMDKAKYYNHYNKLGTKDQQLIEKTQRLKMKVSNLDNEVQSLQNKYQEGVRLLQKERQIGQNQKQKLRELQEKQRQLVKKIDIFKRQERIVVDFLSHQYLTNPKNAYGKYQKQRKKKSSLANSTLLIYNEWKDAFQDQIYQRCQILEKSQRLRQMIQSKLKILQEKKYLKNIQIEFIQTQMNMITPNNNL